MAKITLGMASVHGPQITLLPDSWDLRVNAMGFVYWKA
jgi:hypothetical protein